MRRSTNRTTCRNRHGDGVWHERDDGAEDHDDQAHPDPGNQRIHVRFNDRTPSRFVPSFINQIEIAHQKQVFTEARINTWQSLRLLAGFIKAAFGIHGRDLLAAAEHVDDRPLVAVVGIVVLRVRLADQSVGADRNLVAKRHFFFDFFIERSPEDSNDYQRYAEVDDVSAVAPRVSVAELNHGRDQILLRLAGDDTPPRRNSEITLKITSAESTAASVA